MALFRPKEIINTYTDLDIERLRKEGFDTIFIDVDNTIAIPNTGTCDERAEKFLNYLKEAGFKVVILSNNNSKRVKMFLRDIDADYVSLALKPLPFGYIRGLIKSGSKPSKTIVLGDQLLTDILGANICGCYGIYTKRLQKKDSKLTAFNRRIEDFVWRNILHEKV